MPRTKGSKNRPKTTHTDYASQITEKQESITSLTAEISSITANIDTLKAENSYDNWNIGSPYSRRLLLCYCVECGLKCLIMENDNIYTISQADDETAKILGSHDFRTLLKRVGQAGTYRFKSFPTEYGNTVGTADYHQLCRYLIAPAEQNITYLQEFDHTLAEIKEWLKEVV